RAGRAVAGGVGMCGVRGVNRLPRVRDDLGILGWNRNALGDLVWRLEQRVPVLRAPDQGRTRTREGQRAGPKRPPDLRPMWLHGFPSRLARAGMRYARLCSPCPLYLASLSMLGLGGGDKSFRMVGHPAAPQVCSSVDRAQLGVRALEIIVDDQKIVERIMLDLLVRFVQALGDHLLVVGGALA